MTVRELNESPLGPASLLRAAADRELTPDQERLLEVHLLANPADNAGIAFERALRSAVGRTMGQERAPAHLAERIARAIHADDSSLDTADSSVEHEPPVVEIIASQTRQRSFWTTMGGRLAVAAALVLAVGGLWYASSNLGRQPIAQWNESAKLQLAGFLSEEHMRCDDPEYAELKFIARDMQGIVNCCLTILDQTPQLEQIFENGATLIGLGPCKVPGPGRSVHMQVLMPIDESGTVQSTVSLFMQRSAGRAGMVSGESFDLQEAKNMGFVVNVWEKDGLIYYLVCDSVQAAQAARKALRVIAPNQSL